MDAKYVSGALGFASGLACSLALYIVYRLCRLCLHIKFLRTRSNTPAVNAQTHTTVGDDKCAGGEVTKVFGNETLAAEILEGADSKMPDMMMKEITETTRENTNSTRVSDPNASPEGSEISYNSYFACIPDEVEANLAHLKIYTPQSPRESEVDRPDTWELGKDCSTPKMSAKVCVDLEEARHEMGFEGDIEEIASRVCVGMDSSGLDSGILCDVIDDAILSERSSPRSKSTRSRI